MKRITTLIIAATLATATSVSAQNAGTSNEITPIEEPVVVFSSAGPALGLTPGLIAAGIAITVIGIAASSSNGT
ncbi:hypothetical protein L0664_01260 [Octadecabacter sp. G9-8]|uniref:Ferrochelatase n=1 Tax=Octadecabacter dasysiphoniae TaxID=2909341 RepID=A0ABS9CRW6_9RHOB|nr:hypothetical protein [Octadecabacter dasysiphoniae]MCF2869681.1 hypothetical protein [Octadecabacter dasysiphoniae]